MVTQPTVSVLMTAYNRERYIGAAIESILVQTFRDFELLIVDDCSTDGTLAVAKEYAACDDRIRIVCNEQNLGQFPNRNRAADLARGRYLKYADSDDVMYPYCLDVMVRLLDTHPEADFLLSIMKSWYAGPAPAVFTPRMCYQRHYLGSGLFGNCPGAGLFRADCFRRLGGFPNMGIASDAIFLMRACAQCTVVIAPGDLFWYRVHPSQEYQSERTAYDEMTLQGDYWKALSLDSCPLNEDERQAARRIHVTRELKSALKNAIRGRLRKTFNRLRLAGPSLSEWIRYAGGARIDAFAGARRDDAGEFIVPGWPGDSTAAIHRRHIV